jgi:SAM-dependent methyltransferase
MDDTDAVELIRGAVPRARGTWADLGAGDGTFTRALLELIEKESRVYVVDRDASAVAALKRWAKSSGNDVVGLVADIARPFRLPGPGVPALDGMLLANALHFVRDAEATLARLVKWLRPGGRLVLVEYDGRSPSRWVPYPVPFARLPAITAAAGLSTPTITATRPSLYGGTLYVAASDRLASEPRRGSG